MNNNFQKVTSESHYLKIDKNDIEEKYWRLIELYGEKISVSENQTEPHLILREKEKSVKGKGGCNSFAGTYELPGGKRMVIILIVSTMD